MPASVFHIHCQRNRRRGPCPLLHCAPLSPCVGSPDQFFNHWRFDVNCYLTAKRESIDIECDSRKRRAHRNTEHSHRATLGLIFHYGEAISPPWPCWLDEWREFPQNDNDADHGDDDFNLGDHVDRVDGGSLDKGREGGVSPGDQGLARQRFTRCHLGVQYMNTEHWRGGFQKCFLGFVFCLRFIWIFEGKTHHCRRVAVAIIATEELVVIMIMMMIMIMMVIIIFIIMMMIVPTKELTLIVMKVA